MSLLIKDLHVEVEGKEIIKGLNLEVKEGEVIALMGTNGSGKSTLANTIMGHPDYTITKGSIAFNGEIICGTHSELNAEGQPLEPVSMEPDERARLGIFLSFQHPVAIPGLNVSDYLKEITQVARNTKLRVMAFRKEVQEKMQTLGMNEAFLQRYLNEGFSGGEKKRMEILQFALLEPKLAILDETDSGLDIDALQHVAKGVKETKKPETSVIVITHYKRMLDYLQPNRVVVMKEGNIVHEGGQEVIDKLEEEGYEWMKEAS